MITPDPCRIREISRHELNPEDGMTNAVAERLVASNRSAKVCTWADIWIVLFPDDKLEFIYDAGEWLCWPWF